MTSGISLHKVIIDILNSSDGKMSVKKIHNILKSKELWRRKSDNKIPEINQLYARISSYSEYFDLEKGLVSLKQSQKTDCRLCKIVWNSNYWVKPIERKWSPSNQGKENKGYEEKHGFVHEDWLFNSKFIFEGYQYGYIRGIEKLNSTVKRLNTIYLFTINPNTKERFYIGKLHNVDCLKTNEISLDVISKIQSYKNDMIQELKDTGADWMELKKIPFLPNMRFKVEDKELFPNPFIIDSNWFASKYFRTLPMKMNDDLYKLFNKIENELKFYFKPSSPEGKSNNYTKHTKEGVTNVPAIHNDIAKSLYSYLITNGMKKSKIACDTISFGGKLADMVVQHNDDKYDIYEIKTDTDIRRGLREAIGQLLDYATWEKSIEVKSIYAVLPYQILTENILSFVERLRKNIHIDFHLLLFNKETNEFLKVL